MTIKNILMAGAALYTVSTVPTFAGTAPNIGVIALHAGNATAKTTMHIAASNITYTMTVSTRLSTKDAYNVKTPLASTYYTFINNTSICQPPSKEKVTFSTKKTAYASLSAGTETYSEGCSAPTVFYGDVYDLTTKKAKGKTDSFTSTLSAKFMKGGVKYNGQLILDVSVPIFN